MLITEETNLYLVQQLIDDEESCSIMTAGQIFDMMDLEDCYDIRIDLFRIRGYSETPEECQFHGKWSDLRDPQKMWISCGGKILDKGWGREH